MTPEIIVHHPIPEDLRNLLENLGYKAVDVASSRTRFSLTAQIAVECAEGFDGWRASASRKAIWPGECFIRDEPVMATLGCDDSQVPKG